MYEHVKYNSRVGIDGLNGRAIIGFGMDWIRTKFSKYLLNALEILTLSNSWNKKSCRALKLCVHRCMVPFINSRWTVKRAKDY
jgi:hypothetical protein